jgi:SAM-dependent methyltransferase
MRRVAVIGLGTGTLAAYARTGDTMTFYEIDPVVRTVAADPAYFTYVTDARNRAALLRVELGDARVRLDAVRRERPGERYDLLIVDAFTSDAIPVHLLTREALRLYFEVLAPDGLLALHLSNRYLRLEPVVGNLVEDAGLGGRLLQHDDAPETEGANRSTWAVLARRPEALGALARDERWTTATLDIDPGVGTWTDDFHNVLSVFKW